MSEVDLAAPERWLDSQRRSRSRRFAAARAAAKRRFRHRSSVAMIAVFAIGATGAAAQSTSPGTSATQSSTVAQVQAKLGIAADGVHGPQTRRAVKRFQRQNGLTVDGVIGPETLSALGLSETETAPTEEAATTSSTDAGSALEIIAQCESGGDPTAVSSTGQYRGKYQFDRKTWKSMGGTGDPAAAPEATQDELAAALYEARGTAPWPVCGQNVG